MRQSDREDDKVIQLFKKLPTVEDKRSMDEIYRNIKLGMNKKQKKPIFVPVLTSIAGLLVFLLIFPFIFQTSPIDYLSSQSKVQESADSGSTMNQAAESRKLEKDMNKADEKITMYTEEAMDVKSTLKTAVYEEETIGNDMYTFGVVTTKDGVAIPITLLEQESTDGDWLKQNREKAKAFNAQAYGFRDFSTLLEAMKINVEAKEARITINPENRPFFETNEKQLEYMVQYLMRSQNIRVVKFVNENDEPAELSHFGIVQEVKIEKNMKKAYFLYPVSKDSEYLVPADLISDSLADALKDMKNEPNDFYKTVIPDTVSAEVVKEDNSDVTIKFDKRIELDQGDQLKNMQLIEGILLTAKEFGKTEVQFENIEPLQWESFQFDQPIKVPIAPNLIKR